jgi:hypothetical protein
MRRRSPNPSPLSTLELLAQHNAAVVASAWLVEASHRLLDRHCALVQRWLDAIQESREVLARSVPQGDVTRLPGS